jgi:hypothetical protein
MKYRANRPCISSVNLEPGSKDGVPDGVRNPGTVIFRDRDVRVVGKGSGSGSCGDPGRCHGIKHT